MPASIHPGIIFSSYLLSKNIQFRLYRTLVLRVALYWCETQSLVLREEHRSVVFGSMMLRKIFGTKRDEVTEEWRRLHSEDFV